MLSFIDFIELCYFFMKDIKGHINMKPGPVPLPVRFPFSILQCYLPRILNLNLLTLLVNSTDVVVGTYEKILLKYAKQSMST